MSKIQLNDIANLQNESSATNKINRNNELIEEAIDNTLSRDGSSPNAMEADLDLNGHRILNLPAPVLDTEPLRLGDVSEFELDDDALTIVGASGLLAKTSSSNITTRSMANASAGLTWTNADGVSGNPTPVLANDLAAVEALSGTGLVRRTGSDTWSAGTTIATAEIADDAVTYAKIQDVATTDRILGRDTVGAGVIEELTLSAVLDFIGSAAQGDILYRGAASWARLGAGTSGHFLQTQGAGANPQWASQTANQIVKLTDGTVTAAATLDIVLTGYTAYRGLIFELYDFLPANDGVPLYIRFSTDGGSSYDATGYNYTVGNFSDGGAAAASGSGSANQIQASVNIGNAATEGYNCTVKLLGQTSTSKWVKVTFDGYLIDNNATPAGYRVSGGGSREAAQDTDAIRFLFSAGNIASGSYAVFGIP